MLRHTSSKVCTAPTCLKSSEVIQTLESDIFLLPVECVLVFPLYVNPLSMPRVLILMLVLPLLNTCNDLDLVHNGN